MLLFHQRAIINQVDAETISKAIFGKLPRDIVERIYDGFFRAHRYYLEKHVYVVVFRVQRYYPELIQKWHEVKPKPTDHGEHPAFFICCFRRWSKWQTKWQIARKWIPINLPHPPPPRPPQPTLSFQLTQETSCVQWRSSRWGGGCWPCRGSPFHGRGLQGWRRPPEDPLWTCWTHPPSAQSASCRSCSTALHTVDTNTGIASCFRQGRVDCRHIHRHSQPFQTQHSGLQTHTHGHRQPFQTHIVDCRHKHRHSQPFQTQHSGLQTHTHWHSQPFQTQHSTVHHSQPFLTHTHSIHPFTGNYIVSSHMESTSQQLQTYHHDVYSDQVSVCPLVWWENLTGASSSSDEPVRPLHLWLHRVPMLMTNLTWEWVWLVWEYKKPDSICHSFTQTGQLLNATANNNNNIIIIIIKKITINNNNHRELIEHFQKLKVLYNLKKSIQCIIIQINRI